MGIEEVFNHFYRFFVPDLLIIGEKCPLTFFKTFDRLTDISGIKSAIGTKLFLSVCGSLKIDIKLHITK